MRNAAAAQQVYNVAQPANTQNYAQIDHHPLNQNDAIQQNVHQQQPVMYPRKL